MQRNSDWKSEWNEVAPNGRNEYCGLQHFGWTLIFGTEKLPVLLPSMASPPPISPAEPRRDFKGNVGKSYIKVNVEASAGGPSVLSERIHSVPSGMPEIGRGK